MKTPAMPVIFPMMVAIVIVAAVVVAIVMMIPICSCRAGENETEEAGGEKSLKKA